MFFFCIQDFPLFVRVTTSSVCSDLFHSKSAQSAMLVFRTMSVTIPFNSLSSSQLFQMRLLLFLGRVRQYVKIPPLVLVPFQSLTSVVCGTRESRSKCNLSTSQCLRWIKWYQMVKEKHHEAIYEATKHSSIAPRWRPVPTASTAVLFILFVLFEPFFIFYL